MLIQLRAHLARGARRVWGSQERTDYADGKELPLGAMSVQQRMQVTDFAAYVQAGGKQGRPTSKGDVPRHQALEVALQGAACKVAAAHGGYQDIQSGLRILLILLVRLMPNDEGSLRRGPAEATHCPSIDKHLKPAAVSAPNDE